MTEGELPPLPPCAHVCPLPLGCLRRIRTAPKVHIKFTKIKQTKLFCRKRCYFEIYEQNIDTYHYGLHFALPWSFISSTVPGHNIEKLKLVNIYSF